MGKPSHANDMLHMQHALRLAARNLGATGENPSVGCVLVQDGAVVGTGVTGLDGAPHAETQALLSAGAMARGATAYVTLEPCNHHGKTPPCAKALIEAGVSRVVVACADVNPQVAGQGIAALQQAGLVVTVGVCEAEALLQHNGFFRRLNEGLPRVTLKLARSADGFMGYKNPEKRYITDILARRHGQAIRARAGAVITGIGTVLADDPMMDVRIEGLENRSPKRIVVDRQLQLPAHMKLVQTARQRDTFVFTRKAALADKAQEVKTLEAYGVRVMATEKDTLDIADILHATASLGVNHALIEAGPTFSAVALATHLVDVVYDYVSPIALHEEGSHPFKPDFSQMGELLYQTPLAPDMLSVYAMHRAESA